MHISPQRNVNILHFSAIILHFPSIILHFCFTLLVIHPGFRRNTALYKHAMTGHIIKDGTGKILFKGKILFNTGTMTYAYSCGVYFIQACNDLFILPGSTVLEMETSQDQVDRQAECSYGFIHHIAYPPMRTTAYYGKLSTSNNG